MKYSLSALALMALSAMEVAAFPAAMYEEMAKRGSDIASTQELEGVLENWIEKRATPGFDASKQYVSNQGAHAFVAPKNVNTRTGDQRGPCPGLNAMANHGYLPHNGIATIDQFIQGTYQVFGMGKDLGGFLALYGAIFDGNLGAWSIGGPSTQLPSLPLLLSTPQGISGSHNKYEGDVSPTRGDLYEYGDNYKVVVSQFQELFELQPDAATANYDLSVLTAFRATRFQQSIDNNPYFFNGPFSGVLVQPAAFTFIYRFMGNKSAEHPEGVLNQEVLKAFFAITGDSGNFVWTEGYEKIPDNWYKRAIGDEYTIPFFLTDVIAAALEHPEFLSIGGNTGTTNSFAGVDLKQLTKGLFDVTALLDPNNLGCFLRQILQGVSPDILQGGLNGADGSILGSVSQLVGTLLGGILPGITCPQLVKIDTSQLDNLPGYAKNPQFSSS